MTPTVSYSVNHDRPSKWEMRLSSLRQLLLFPWYVIVNIFDGRAAAYVRDGRISGFPWCDIVWFMWRLWAIMPLNDVLFPFNNETIFWSEKRAMIESQTRGIQHVLCPWCYYVKYRHYRVEYDVCSKCYNAQLVGAPRCYKCGGKLQ